MDNRGFTLLELIIVITIIGLIASIMVVSINESRRKARNEAVVSQMYEYQKAIELNYSDTGVYPHPNGGQTRERVLCIGDGLFVGDDCLGSLSRSYNVADSSVIEGALKNYLSLLPRFAQPSGILDYSSPAYSGCTSDGTPPHANSNTSCTENDYSIWYLLEGTDEDCGGRADVANNNLSGVYTLCRLQSSR